MSEPVAFARARDAAIGLAVRRPAEDVDLGDALGRTPAVTIVASEDIVPFARAAMDGYAVASIDTAAGARFEVTGRAYAGDATVATGMRARGAIAIATGAPMPRGTDAVVPIERVRTLGEAIEIDAPFAAGAHVFPPGDDARAGDVLARAGEPLRPGTIALLAAAGVERVSCAPRVRVAVVATGDELARPGEALASGRIRNSNGPLVAALATAHGALVVRAAHVRDDPHALAETIGSAAAEADLVVTTGGASVGERDYLKAVLARLGAEFAFSSVAMRPGRPTAMARLGDARALVLPGNPAAAFVCFHAFAVPFVRASLGAPDPIPRRVKARLAGELHGKAERTYFAFVAVCVAPDGRLEASPLDNQCSALTRTASDAAGFAILGPERGDVRRGDDVELEVFAWDRVR